MRRCMGSGRICSRVLCTRRRAPFAYRRTSYRSSTDTLVSFATRAIRYSRMKWQEYPPGCVRR